MTPDCTTCKHYIKRWDNARAEYQGYCRSPQLAASTRREMLCIFERYPHEEGHDWYRDTPEKRKCGREGLNYEAKA